MVRNPLPLRAFSASAIASYPYIHGWTTGHVLLVIRNESLLGYLG